MTRHHTLPAAPRAVAWGALVGRSWGWLAAGLALIAGGAARLAAAGAAPGNVFADPARGRSDATPVGLLVLPGLVCVAVWLRSAIRLRVLLATGRAAPVEIEFQQRVLLVVPEQNYVGFAYTDDVGNEHRGRQWVTAGGIEGECLRRGGIGLMVLYDPDRPQHGRLVARARFGHG